jgi:hypothetical protein
VTAVFQVASVTAETEAVPVPWERRAREFKAMIGQPGRGTNGGPGPSSTDVPLQGVRAEFREALRQEIEAARRNATNTAVPLVNGRRIAQVGAGFQYLFEVENALNAPGDAPGDLYVAGPPPVEVVIISIDGMSVTLSVPNDLGEFVPSARRQSNLTQLMRKLITRIEALGDKPNPAGERIRGAAPVAGTPIAVHLPNLNAGQRAAVASAMGRDTTFIWGPPGTGKTHTIGALGGSLFEQGRSLLMVSHTNTAVDQALLKIADELARSHPEAAAEGKVLRIGDPVDPQLLDRKDLLLATHIARRSEVITARREVLVKEHERLVGEAIELGRRIAVVEWLVDAAPDLRSMTADLDDLHAVEAQLAGARAELDKLSGQERRRVAALAAAETAQQAISALRTARGRAADGRRRHAQASVEQSQWTAQVAEAEQVLALAADLEPHRRRAGELPSLGEQREAAVRARRTAAEKAKAHEAFGTELIGAEGVLAETISVGGLARRWKRLPAPEEQQRIVDELRDRVEGAATEYARARTVVDEAESVVAEVEMLDALLAPHASVPREQAQAAVLDELRRAEAAALSTAADAGLQVDRADQAISASEAVLAAFDAEYRQPPAEVITWAEAEAAKLVEAKERAARLARHAEPARDALEDLLAARLAALREWGLSRAQRNGAEAMLAAVVNAHAQAARDNAGTDVGKLRAEQTAVNARLVAIESEVAQIDELLKKVEDLVIADAAVVATTLTRAYLRDSIQARRFDTVVLDEASMAPIPALWVAASLSDSNVIAVGDYKQLPPIVMSTAAEAERWLGRDIFAVAGIQDHRSAPDYFIPLTEQFRMHPNISAIANELIYDGLLTNGPGTDDDSGLSGWYEFEWGHDSPVLLVNTASTGAWVTSVSRGERSSRLNFLSATVCVDLAHQLLRSGRAELPPGAPARILIVSPYRPHAKLVELLLREETIAGEVRAGTAHTFQGSEADVVILDLVNDDPHWRVNLFMPDLDDRSRRLLNVALTRARRRLIVVGDLEYNAQQGRRAFLGRELLPALRGHPVVDALEVVPAGLAARAAKAQSAVLGGEVEPDADRVAVTQRHFFPMLAGDLARARRRVVIYSPFITENRLGQLEPQIKAAVARGVQFFVVTKPGADRSARDVPNYRLIEEFLADWGVVVVHKRRMHEKLVFIDDTVLWSGSLNPLSFADTQEIMERRRSAQVVADYAKTLRLSELVGEYQEGAPACPICGSEIVASEGRDDPYFWRCIEEHCYSRNIDGPRLMNGMVNCANCGAPVEFGEWGNEYKWRCTANARHRQNIARTHLRLPAMRRLVPKRALRQLDREFGTTGTTTATERAKAAKPSAHQFDFNEREDVSNGPPNTSRVEDLLEEVALRNTGEPPGEPGPA